MQGKGTTMMVEGAGERYYHDGGGGQRRGTTMMVEGAGKRYYHGGRGGREEVLP